MKVIKNYENYQIDENGNIYNLNTKKFLKGSIGENGYKYYRLSKNGLKKMLKRPYMRQKLILLLKRYINLI